MARERWTRFFLWCLVVSFGIALGAKIYDLAVLATAWGAAPPTSLALLPYGARYPVDPGQFFEPLSAAMLVFLLAALIAGWKTPWKYRTWLVVPLIAFAIVCALTVATMWPITRELTEVATNNLKRSEGELIGTVQQWFAMDALRVLLIAIGYFGVIRAISVPYPQPVVVEEEPVEVEAEPPAEETKKEELKSQLYER